MTSWLPGHPTPHVNWACLSTAGSGYGGQLGDGNQQSAEVPVQVATDLLFIDITAGAEHTCGLLANGSYACWGKSGSISMHMKEWLCTTMPLGGFAVWVREQSCTAPHCLLAGQNYLGQLADGTTTRRLLPTLIVGDAPTKAIASGAMAYHTIFMRVRGAPNAANCRSRHCAVTGCGSLRLP